MGSQARTVANDLVTIAWGMRDRGLGAAASLMEAAANLLFEEDARTDDEAPIAQVRHLRVQQGSMIGETTPSGDLRIYTAHSGGIVRPDGSVVIERADLSDLIGVLSALRRALGPRP